MRVKIKVILAFQLIFNVFLLSNVNSQVTREDLNPMNRIKSQAFIDTSNNKKGKSYKILVIGNSISYHGHAEKIGWNHISGMAASRIENDYAHIIFKKTEELLPGKKLSMRITNMADFERNYSTFDFASIENLINYKPNLIIFQLGENVSFSETNTPPLLKSKYIDLISKFTRGLNPLVICTTTFWGSKELNEIIEQVALTTNSYMVDLGHLGSLNPENFAKNEISYAGDKTIWKVEGIGMHPGDLGMRNIAQQIFIVINASIHSNRNR